MQRKVVEVIASHAGRAPSDQAVSRSVPKIAAPRHLSIFLPVIRG
jgi:hypothetical protein